MSRWSLPAAFVMTGLFAGCSQGSGDGVGLLTLEDIRSVPGAPNGLQRVDPGAVAIANDPDPRGPCGAFLNAGLSPAPDDHVAAARSDIVTTEVLVPVDAVTERFLEATQDDLRPGCDAFTKASADGRRQVVELLAALGVPEPAGTIAFTSVARVDAAEPVYVATGLSRVGSQIGMVGVFGLRPIDSEFVTALTVLASRRLETTTP